MPNFTTEDLLLYLYDEMKQHKKAAFENELLGNWALREKLQVLKEAKKRLEKLNLQSPRELSLRAIIEYANHTSEISR
jgi:hypothetical protein